MKSRTRFDQRSARLAASAASSWSSSTLSFHDAWSETMRIFAEPVTLRRSAWPRSRMPSPIAPAPMTKATARAARPAKRGRRSLMARTVLRQASAAVKRRQSSGGGEPLERASHDAEDQVPFRRDKLEGRVRDATRQVLAVAARDEGVELALPEAHLARDGVEREAPRRDEGEAVLGEPLLFLLDRLAPLPTQLVAHDRRVDRGAVR